MNCFDKEVLCDLYLGRGAGKMLMNDIKSARQSVKIVSPYLSESYVEELIELRQRGVDVSLVTMDKEKGWYRDRNIHQIIRQYRTIDEPGLLKRQKMQKLSRIVLSLAIVLAIVEFILCWEPKSKDVLYGLIPVALAFGSFAWLRYRIKHQRIYMYYYDTMFPFKVFFNNQESFVHTKLYIIDDRVAYLGSMNFTHSGMKTNFESRIKTEDLQTIQRLNEHYHDLLYRSPLYSRDIQMWGPLLYPEPIN